MLTPLIPVTVILNNDVSIAHVAVAHKELVLHVGTQTLEDCVTRYPFT